MNRASWQTTACAGLPVRAAPSNSRSSAWPRSAASQIWCRACVRVAGGGPAAAAARSRLPSVLERRSRSAACVAPDAEINERTEPAIGISEAESDFHSYQSTERLQSTPGTGRRRIAPVPEDSLEGPGDGHGMHGRDWTVGLKQPDQLHLQPFAGYLLESRERLGDGVQVDAVVPLAAKPSEHAEITEDSEVVLVDPVCRGSHEPHAPARKVLQAEIVKAEDAKVRPRIQRIEREIAALSVSHPIVRKLDLGSPPERSDVATERGDFDRPRVVRVMEAR